MFFFFLPHEFLMNMTKYDEYDQYLRMMMRMPLPPPTDDDHEHVFTGTVTCIEYGIGMNLVVPKKGRAAQAFEF